MGSLMDKEKEFAKKLIEEVLEKLNAKEEASYMKQLLRGDEYLKNTPPPSTLKMIKTLTLYNILLNILEERSSIQNKDCFKQIQDSFLDLKQNLSKQSLQDIFSSLCFYPVFTAHPTESRRRTFLEAHFSIDHDLHKLFDLKERPDIRAQRITNIQYRLNLLWNTSLIRDQKLEVLFELDNLLFIVTKSILPNARRTLRLLDELLEGELSSSPIILGSWIGGDRDGNPYVDNKTMIRVVKEQHRVIINLYLKWIASLERELSLSQEEYQPCHKFLHSIELEKQHLPPNLLSKYSKEPFRAKLRLMHKKLKNRLTGIHTHWENPFVYRDIEEFIKDIKLIEQNLPLGSKKNIKQLRYLAMLGDFFLLRLDFREHKEVFLKALSEIFAFLGVSQNFLELEEESKIHILNLMLEEEILSLEDFKKNLSSKTQECIEIFHTISWIKNHFGKKAIHSFILSMTKNPSDLLVVLYLAKLTGLWKKGSAQIAITPLFETISDLKNSYTILQSLSKNPHYRRYLRDCDNTQEIMVGYSDSSKDGGIFASSFHLHTSISNLMNLGDKLGIKFILFHGRGGSVSRGGGSLSSALEAAPPNSLKGCLKVTEQGEVISSKYLSPLSAQYNLANTLSTLLRLSNPLDSKISSSREISPSKNAQKLREISELSMRTYRNLVYETKGFYEYFQSVTPIEFIQKLNLGSRPSKRNLSDRIEDLRAIPWVFAWTQNRSILPSWYGVGSALFSMDKNQLQDLYLESIFFKTTIDNISQAFLKVDLEIAGLYHDFMQDQTLCQKIKTLIWEEHEKTLECLLLTRREKELLESEEITRNSILMRKNLINTLNKLQITLIKNYKNTKEHNQRNQILKEIHSTIVGIAQGLRNTG